jgi:hypothetical protein
MYLWKYSRIAVVSLVVNADPTDGDATMQNGLISPCEAITKALEGRQKSIAMDIRRIVYEATCVITDYFPVCSKSLAVAVVRC